MAKVVLCDNFYRGTVSDKVLKSDITFEEAERISNEYNEKYPDDHEWLAIAVKDDYELFKAIGEVITNP